MLGARAFAKVHSAKSPNRRFGDLCYCLHQNLNKDRAIPPASFGAICSNFGDVRTSDIRADKPYWETFWVIKNVIMHLFTPLFSSPPHLTSAIWGKYVPISRHLKLSHRSMGASIRRWDASGGSRSMSIVRLSLDGLITRQSVSCQQHCPPYSINLFYNYWLIFKIRI